MELFFSAQNRHKGIMHGEGTFIWSRHKIGLTIIIYQKNRSTGG